MYADVSLVYNNNKLNSSLLLSLQGNGPMPKLDNPGPGTVLDHTITRKDWYVINKIFLN